MSAHHRQGIDSKCKVRMLLTCSTCTPMLGLLIGVWLRGYLGTEVAKKTALSQKPMQAWMTSHVSCNLKSLYTMSSWNTMEVAQQVRGRLLQAAQPTSASSMHLSLSDYLSEYLSLIYTWRGKGLVNLVSFSYFLMLLSCLLPMFKELPYRVECFTPFRASSLVIDSCQDRMFSLDLDEIAMPMSSRPQLM